MSDNGVDKRQLGKTRLDFLHEPKIGLFSDSPFDLQYILIPQSLPRSVSENFKEQFTQMIQGFTSHPYKIQTVLYNDIDASNLFKQVKAIKDALSEANVQRGYVLLILPKNTHEDLHNYLKRESWPKFQLQCAMATKILNFYEPISGEITPRYRVKEYLAGKYSSYLRNTALGMLIVNRKWLWALKDALNYDAYIGIDVLNNMAGVSFIYNNAQRCFFRDFPSQQKEKLLSKQIQKIIYDSLKEDIEKHGLSPKSVIVHRDGRTYPQEIKGFSTAIQKLKDENLLEKNASTGIVEIHKESAKKLRLVNLTDNGQLNNPTIGTPFIINQLEGIVCNTGWPFNLMGTVKPLHAVIAFGNLDISQVLEDIFSLSQLIWLAPDKCGRLPVTIRLANDFLEPIASESDEDEAIYGEDADEELKEEFEE
jgi:hypothetical protein